MFKRDGRRTARGDRRSRGQHAAASRSRDDLSSSSATSRASVLFILGLRSLTRPSTARRGMQQAAIGMLLADRAARSSTTQIVDYRWIAAGLVLGALIGYPLGMWVPMTAMPQRIAIVADASARSRRRSSASPSTTRASRRRRSASTRVTMAALGLRGAARLAHGDGRAGRVRQAAGGAPVAAGHVPRAELRQRRCCSSWRSGCSSLPSCDPTQRRGVLRDDRASPRCSACCWCCRSAAPTCRWWSRCSTRTAGSPPRATGFALGNSILIICGALDGASGFLLSMLMSKAMNRSFANVLFGAFGSDDGRRGGGRRRRRCPCAAISRGGRGDAARLRAARDRRPRLRHGGGAGAAPVRELAELIEKRGGEVKYAIHPVAGRMPGHMNVELSQAGIDYDLLLTDVDERRTRCSNVLMCDGHRRERHRESGAIDDPARRSTACRC